MATLTERLKELRGSALQRDIAAVLGVQQSTYTLYENGKREPGLDSICKLAKYYGVSTDYILGITEDSNPDPELGAISEKIGIKVEALNSLIETVEYNKEHGFPIINDSLSDLILDVNFMYGVSQIKHLKSVISAPGWREPLPFRNLEEGTPEMSRAVDEYNKATLEMADMVRKLYGDNSKIILGEDYAKLLSVDIRDLFKQALESVSGYECDKPNEFAV